MVFSLFVLLLLYISRKDKFFIKGFFIKYYMQEMVTCFRKNTLFISFFKQIITYHYLILTYFHVHTFTNNVSALSQPKSPG